MKNKVTKIGEMIVPLEVVLGRTTQTVASLTRISEGTIIELHKLAGEPVDLVANGEVIARGEVVVIDENFGLRVTEITDNKE